MGEQQLHQDVGSKTTPKSEHILVMTNWVLPKDGTILLLSLLNPRQQTTPWVEAPAHGLDFSGVGRALEGLMDVQAAGAHLGLP